VADPFGGVHFCGGRGRGVCEGLVCKGNSQGSSWIKGFSERDIECKVVS